MAKKKTQRERPTLTTVRALRADLAEAQTQLVKTRNKLSAVEETAAAETVLGIEHGNSLTTARGLLHAVLDDSNQHSVLTNRIRQFLGRGGEQVLHSRVELVLAGN